MLSLTLTKPLKRNKKNVTKHPLVHLMQTGENGCWAASAWMIGHSVNNGSTQNAHALASSFLGKTPHTNCPYKDCVVHLHGGVVALPDVPLCLTCKLRLLRHLVQGVSYKLDVHTVQFSLQLSSASRTSAVSGNFGEPKAPNVKAVLNSHPIGAYCSVGKQAHYSVIYGFFEIIFDNKPFDVLMISDPWEYGPGICDFDTFTHTGKYKRTGKRRDSPSFHWTASLVA